MCLACCDADKKAEMIKKDPDCDGNLTPFMTMKQLKEYCLEEWVREGKTKFKIIRAGIINPIVDQFSWLTHNAQLSVQFV